MSEYIGAKISLISRSDIRYVGTLHEINSENSTVALEQVISYGTEGRRGDPDKEIPRTDTVYEYIVFRGSDVKDLRIEEPAKPQPPKPQVPDDPAILGTTQPANYNRPGAAPAAAAPPPPPQQMPPQNQFQQPPGPPFYGQQMRPPPPNQFYNPYQQTPYGGFMQPPPAFPSQFAQQQQQQHPGAAGARGPAPGQFGPGPQQPPQQGPAPQGQQPQGVAPQAPGAPPKQPQAQQPVNKAAVQQNPPVSAGSKSATPAPQADGIAQAPIKEADKPLVPPTGPAKANQGPPPPFALKQNVPSGPKNARTNVAPALPLASPARQPAAEPVAKPVKAEDKQPTAADAAAVEELAQKVSQLKTSPGPKTAQGGAGTSRTNGYSGVRGGRGGRGGFRDQAPRKVEVPAADYDFDAANAKFNKQDLVKEVIATVPTDPVSPVAAQSGEQQSNGTVAVEAPVVAEPSYNRGKSFFDNISCENKDRAENAGQENRRGWRGEEQRKNLETFGQGSVDSYGGNRYGRGGWRGRGRGGYRRGGGYGGRGGGFNRGQQAVSQQ